MKRLINVKVSDSLPNTKSMEPYINGLFRIICAIILLVAIDFRLLFSEQSTLALILAFFAAGSYWLLALLLTLDPSVTEPSTDILEPATLLFTENIPRHKLQKIMPFIDAFILGFLLLLIPFSLGAVFATGLLVIFRGVSLAGGAALFGHSTLFASGALLSVAITTPTIAINPLEPISLAVLIGTPLFLISIGWLLYKQRNELSIALAKSAIENKQLTINNYKLAKYLSPTLRKAIFSGKRVALETQRKKLSIFFSDIKGFSELSEQLETETLTNMLNLYLTEMSDIALKFGGTVDKFIGDAVMVFFGDPTSRGVKEDAIACVSMALAMQKRMDDLNLRWSAQGIRHPLKIRIGVNTGFSTVGNFGTENRMDYTLLGTEVNKASRLESAAASDEILISRSTYELVKHVIYCEPRGNIRLKGFAEKAEVFSVIDLRANLGKSDLCIDQVTDGFSIFLDVANVPHLQKQPVMAALEQAYEQIRQDIESNTDHDVKIIK